MVLVNIATAEVELGDFYVEITVLNVHEKSTVSNSTCFVHIIGSYTFEMAVNEALLQRAIRNDIDRDKDSHPLHQNHFPMNFSSEIVGNGG